MSKYMIIDDTGMLPAFYSDDIHEEIPNNAVQITDELWDDFLSNQGRRKWNGTEFVEYTPPVVEAPKVYTGLDAIDAMSKASANDIRVDQRDIVRIAAAYDVRAVKSKLKRVADALGITVAALIPGVPIT